MMECRDVWYRYPSGVEALRGVNLRVEDGEVKILLGRNGAGKTTLMLTLNGLLKPRRGEVVIDGRRVEYDRRSLRWLRRRVGYVFQNPDDQIVAPTVFQDVAFGLKNLGFDDDEIKRRVGEILRELELQGYEGRLCSTLSGGEKRRVALAGILVMEPKYLLLDEPSAGLDGVGFKSLVSLIQRLKARGKTLLISTHDLELAMAVGDSFAVMNGGRIVHEGEINAEIAEKYGLRLGCFRG